jgi:hypothetical protein
MQAHIVLLFSAASQEEIIAKKGNAKSRNVKLGTGKTEEGPMNARRHSQLADDSSESISVDFSWSDNENEKTYEHVHTKPKN